MQLRLCTHWCATASAAILRGVDVQLFCCGRYSRNGAKVCVLVRDGVSAPARADLSSGFLVVEREQ